MTYFIVAGVVLVLVTCGLLWLVGRVLDEYDHER